MKINLIKNKKINKKKLNKMIKIKKKLNKTIRNKKK